MALRADPRRAWRISPSLRRAALAVLAVLLLPTLLVGWREVGGETINPRFVQRIKNGQTKKHEILTYFGEPKDVERTPEGPVYKYYSYKDAPLTSSKLERQATMTDENISKPFFLDEDRTIKMVKPKKGGKILRSTLTVRFSADGETVMSHEHKEY